MLMNSPAPSCSYCGRPNPDKLSACGECGTLLVTAPPEVAAANRSSRKSKATAVCLALIFGPLGLIYAGGWWQAFVMIMAALPFIITHKAGLWLVVGGRLVAAAWAYDLVAARDTHNPERDAENLLNEATRLENIDFTKAIS